MRWMWLPVLLAVGLAGARGGETNRPGSDWPCFLGPQGTSVSTEKGIISPWPKEGLRIVWHQKVGEGYAAPSVRDGKLYLFDRHGNQNRLTCMRANTGVFIWKFEYPTDFRDKYNYNGGPRCCPVIDGDRVYLHGPEGMLHCVRTDGKLLWKVDTRADFGIVQNFFGVGSTPAVEGNLLIVQVGGSPKGSNARDFINLKGNGSGVVAFDKFTGRVVYRISDELASYASPVLATIQGRRWGLVFARGGLLGFEPATGKIDFHFPWRSEELESVNASNPVIAGDQVLISETYGPGAALLRIKPGGYQVLWSDAAKAKKTMQCHWMTPIVVDGHVYCSSGRHTSNAELRCVELASGKVMWRVPRLGRSSLLLADGHFIGLSEVGILFLFKPNPQRFEKISVMEVREPGAKERLLDYPSWAAPVLSHGLLYLRSEEQLVCLELIPPKKAGATRRRHPPAEQLLALAEPEHKGGEEIPATLRVLLPADAVLTIDEAPTRQTGPERRFITPPLMPGKTYSYTLRWTYEDHGRKVTHMAIIDFQPGKEKLVDLRPGSTSIEASRIVYVPTDEEMVAKMLELGRVTNKDVVYDLGCGDGRILVMAAKKYGARGVGIDIDPVRVREAQANARRQKVDGLVEFRQGDALMVKDLSKATVITLYMLPEFQAKLAPILKKELRPGTRIVVHDYGLPGWQEEESTSLPGLFRPHTLYLYRAGDKK
jgi:outer membrane protein assembly factor BamB